MKKQTHSTPGILYLNLIWIIFSLSKYAFTRHLIEHQSSGTFQFVKVSIVRSSFYLKSTDRYIFSGSYPITEEYFQLSEGQTSTINSEYLVGPPECPYCGSSTYGMCVCEKLLCIKSIDSVNRCPWCGHEANYAISSFDVSGVQIR